MHEVNGLKARLRGVQVVTFSTITLLLPRVEDLAHARFDFKNVSKCVAILEY